MPVTLWGSTGEKSPCACAQVYAHSGKTVGRPQPMEPDEEVEDEEDDDEVWERLPLPLSLTHVCLLNSLCTWRMPDSSVCACMHARIPGTCISCAFLPLAFRLPLSPSGRQGMHGQPALLAGRSRPFPMCAGEPKNKYTN